MIWHKKESFGSLVEAKSYIKHHGSYKFKRTTQTNSGSKIYYYCKFSDQCNGKLHLHLLADCDQVDLYSTGSHDHNPDRTTKGIHATTKVEIKRLMQIGVDKPTRILAALQQEGMELPRKAQLKNFMHQIRTKSGRSLDSPYGLLVSFYDMQSSFSIIHFRPDYCLAS